MSFAIDLGGNTALVTGAGQGVGRAIACALASAGATVHVNDLRDELTEDTIDTIRAAGGSASSAPFDVTDYDAVQQVIGTIDPLDILVNNVALGTLGDTEVDPDTGQLSDADRKALSQYIVRRRGRPDDVAPMVTLLVSPLAEWITGQTIPVNGGYTVNL